TPPAGVRSMRGLNHPVPVVRGDSDDQFVTALAVRFEYRGLAFGHVGPVLAEGFGNVRLVSDNHEILVGGTLADNLAHRLRATLVLLRRDGGAGFSKIRVDSGVAVAEQRSGVDGALQRARHDNADGNHALVHRLADRFRLSATFFAELTLAGALLCRVAHG